MPATLAQPANARHGTGPRTPAGKAASSRNAVSHGLLSDAPIATPFEQPQAWQDHRAALLQELAPAGHLETILAERIALLHWRLARVARYEVALIAHDQHEVAGDNVDRRFALPDGRPSTSADLRAERTARAEPPGPPGALVRPAGHHPALRPARPHPAQHPPRPPRLPPDLPAPPARCAAPGGPRQLLPAPGLDLRPPVGRAGPALRGGVHQRGDAARRGPAAGQGRLLLLHPSSLRPGDRLPGRHAHPERPAGSRDAWPATKRTSRASWVAPPASSTRCKPGAVPSAKAKTAKRLNTAKRNGLRPTLQTLNSPRRPPIASMARRSRKSGHRSPLRQPPSQRPRLPAQPRMTRQSLTATNRGR